MNESKFQRNKIYFYFSNNRCRECWIKFVFDYHRSNFTKWLEFLNPVFSVVDISISFLVKFRFSSLEHINVVAKGGLISERFSLRLQFKKKLPNHRPEHYLPKSRCAVYCYLALFFGAKVKYFLRSSHVYILRYNILPSSSRLVLLSRDEIYIWFYSYAGAINIICVRILQTVNVSIIIIT